MKAAVLSEHGGLEQLEYVREFDVPTAADDVIPVAAPLCHKNALNAIEQGLTAGVC